MGSTPDKQEIPTTSDVDYDEDAVREAAERMGSTGTGTGGQAVQDPEGDHDPDALREAARRTHAE